MTEIWVIDDDRSVRFVLAEALRADGFAVREFERASELRAALVFTDVRMPETDGLQLLDALKAGHPTLPVIVMSAWTDVPSTAGAFRGGALDFLSKPFDLDAAVAMARRALQVAPGHDAPASDEGRERCGVAGRFARDARAVPRRGTAGAGAVVGADHGRDRHRQGAGGARAARHSAARRASPSSN
jgi:two-component system nitrogen regulation response regulator GlnG